MDWLIFLFIGALFISGLLLMTSESSDWMVIGAVICAGVSFGAWLELF